MKKKSVGRPPLADGQTKTKLLQIWLTETDFSRLKIAANREFLPLAVFARQKLLTKL